MKTIHNLSDLKPYGINTLSGEACRVGRRILCDLTEEGADIVADLLGLGDARKDMFGENWNSGSKYSFMLPYSLVTELSIWCLIRDKSNLCLEVIISDDGVHGRERTDTDEEWNDFFDTLRGYSHVLRRVSFKNHPGCGTRCEHQMSGRTE